MTFSLGWSSSSFFPSTVSEVSALSKKQDQVGKWQSLFEPHAFIVGATQFESTAQRVAGVAHESSRCCRLRPYGANREKSRSRVTHVQPSLIASAAC